MALGHFVGIVTFALTPMSGHGCPESGHRARVWSMGMFGGTMALGTGAVVAPVSRVRCLCHKICNSVKDAGT